MIKVFLDTEFTALDKTASLISIGLAAETGAMFYAEITSYDPADASQWVQENVLPHLSGNLRASSNAKVEESMFVRGHLVDISRVLRNWFARFGDNNSIEIWADVLAWDWVLFCDLFGGAFAIPPQVHYIPRDLSTVMVMKGIDPDIEREQLGKVEWDHPKLKLAKHHALYDALLEKSVFDHISK